MTKNHDTLGMPDVLDGDYPVPAPESADGVLGFRFLGVTEEMATGEAPFANRIRQRFGIVHGGVYAGLAEMVASEGTNHYVWEQGDVGVGMSNNTTFMRPITAGTVHAQARVVHRGRTTWVWDVDLVDDDRRVCAVSRVTIAVRPQRKAAK
jgi:1,4-dihydroxy-2-naphthoyl-CoA hydrolase